ncbi:MAG: translation initiation factor IF-3 [Calditrichaeota bacterium]|nr:MAG: translation initiation factor IF-3 [Calditrichota bacterium]
MATKELRINNRIKVSPVRLIGPDGDQFGIIPTAEALERAREYGLDLVEVSPNSRPPVCRILDYGKYKYELAKKDKLAKKRQHTMQMKEMRYRPKIDEHDFQFKTKHVREFIEGGNKVKTFVMFRGREMAYTEYGRKVLDRVAKELEDIAVVESAASQEGRKMIMVLGPNGDVLKKRKQKELEQRKAEKVKQEQYESKQEEVEKEEQQNNAGE